MSSLIPISTYNLALEPFNPVPALDEEFPVTVRLTMAALDPEAADDKDEPSTVRVLKRARVYMDSDEEDEDSEEDELDEEEEEEEEEEEKPKLKKADKKEKKAKKVEEEEEEEEEEDSEEDSEDSDIDDDEEIEEFILCTLSPKTQFQQTLEFTISPAEEVHFVVTGSYPVHLSGNYVEHPADDDEDEYDSEDSDLDDEYYQDAEGDYNLTPDEDELMNIEDLEDESDVERKIEELVEEEQDKKSKKRAAPVEAAEPAKKKEKKDKNNKKDEKKVQFTPELEQGPTPSKDDKKAKGEKKFKTATLLGGVVTEDRKTGTGATAKSGNKVGIRYIGKLKNGKVFDKNTSGKPFVFSLGKGECIKGFDLGVAGMAVGGERRVIIPAKMGYGSQALPGIPANSELTFDIKLVSLK